MKIAMLLNLAGEEVLDVYNTLKLTDQQKANYKETIKVFDEYFNPKKNLVYERYKFFTRNQEENEQFEHFYTEL